MIPDLEKSIFESKKILKNGHYANFEQYDGVYLFTNEKIKDYLNDQSVNSGIALSVIGSGDQIFNLVQMGFKEIDAFDINYLSYYFFWLKFGVIMSCSLKEFFEIARYHFFGLNSGSYLQIIIERIKDKVPKDVYLYFSQLVDYMVATNNPMQYLTRGCYFFYDFANNFYAENETTFRVLQRNLETIDLSFSFCDIRELLEKTSKKYDVILFSNILDYLHLSLEEFQSFNEKFSQMLNEGGSIIEYSFSLYDDSIFDYAKIPIDVLGKENVFTTGMIEGYYRIRKPINTKNE